MPRKHVVKQYKENGYYHVYNRGVNKQRLFFTDDDYSYFLMLFRRHLAAQQQHNKHGYPYPWLKHEVELLAFCLMPNHFHILVKQKSANGITRLMRSLGTAYSMYYKNQHNSVGHIFESQFKASRIHNENYLLHISRYIHLNPRNFQGWGYSSYRYYANSNITTPDWLNIEPMLALFENTNYHKFCRDYMPIMTLLKQQRSDPLEVEYSM